MAETLICYIPARTMIWDSDGKLVSDDTYLYPIRSAEPERVMETLHKGAEALGVSLDEVAIAMHRKKFMEDPQNKEEFKQMNAGKIEIKLAGQITWKYKLKD